MSTSGQKLQTTYDFGHDVDDDDDDGDDGKGDGAHVPNRSCINYLYAICKRRAPSWRLRPLIII